MKYAKTIDPAFVAQFHDQTPPWGPVGYCTYKRTYARMTDAGVTEEWWQTVQRCCNGLLHINGAFTQEEIQRLYWFVFNLKCNFSGRALWQLGTPTVDRLGGDSLMNCFAGETEVLTRGGIFKISEIVGKTVEVQTLTPEGLKWISTEFKSFGRQKLRKVTLANGEVIRATPNHEWMKFENGQPILDKIRSVFTDQLMDRRYQLPLKYSLIGNFSEEGYAHGFVFGDGHKVGETCTVEIFPSKIDMVDLVAGYGNLRTCGMRVLSTVLVSDGSFVDRSMVWREICFLL